MLRSAIKPLVILVVLLVTPYFNSQGLTEQPITIQTLTTSAGAVVIQATRIDLPTNDLIYDPVSGKIYASTPSTAGSYGNRIVPITVPTATLGTPIFVGSEPNRLAVSDNGQYLYVGLDGAAAVRRVNLFTQTADLQFSLGSDYCGSFLAEDMVALKGNPNAVAISRRNTGCSPRHEGVAIYDNGVPRPNSTPDHTGSNVIEPSDSPSILYGYNNETTEFGFRVMSVDNSGVKVISTTTGLLSGFGVDIRFDNGLVYATSGRVINPSTLTLVGTYAASGPVCPDSSSGRVYFLSSSYGSIRLKIFDQSTFVLLGEVTIPTASGSPGSFIKAGENVLAFRTTAGQVFLLQFVELNHQVYLPLVLKPCSTGICGRVTLNGAPAANVYLQLRFFDGSRWSTRSTTYTDQNGNYAFTNVPSLGPGQRYYVLYSNSAGLSGRLRAWGTRELTSYTAGTAVEIGNFDIADIPLVAPSDGATVSLPYTFRWTRRTATPSDSYALALYDSSNYAHTSPLGYVDSIFVNNLPPFVTPGTQYRWEVLAFSPDGGVGISLQARRVTFTNTGVGSASEAPDFSLSPLHLLEGVER